MPDMEKVIKGMAMCISQGECSPDDCPYYDRPDNASGLCWDRLMTDALALLNEQQQQIWELQDQVEYLTDKLKEQEAVEPIKPLDKDDDYTFMCSNCKGELFCGDISRDNFCPTCGKPVKWE